MPHLHAAALLSLALLAPQAVASTPAAETLRMSAAPLADPLMDGMQAYSLLLPEDWQLSGGITWNPLSTWRRG